MARKRNSEAASAPRKKRAASTKAKAKTREAGTPRRANTNPTVRENQALAEQHPPPNPDAAAQAIEAAARPVSDASPKPETQSAVTVQSGPASPADVPPEAQQAVADIEEAKALAEEKIEEKMSPEERIDRLEAALGSGIGINVRNYTGKNIRIEREAKVAEAIEKAHEIIKDALIVASEDLTTEERIERLELALRTGTPLGNLL